MAGSVTLYLTSGSAGAGNFNIYHSSADPNNLIAQNVSAATLTSGYCTNEVYDSYVVQSDTIDCINQVVVFVGDQPTPTPTATPAGPTPTPGTIPSGSDGWTITMGETNFAGSILRGFHRGTLFPCPSTYGYGEGAGNTTTQTALPGTDCYWTSILGPNIEKGYGINGEGTASSLALTMFSTDTNSGTSNFAIVNTSGTGNPGTGALSGTIIGNNGTSGTWSCNYEPLVSYYDNGGNGSIYTPESQGTLVLTGISLVTGVTYNINI